MAFVCQSCRQIHPPGAVSCDQAREMIRKRGREISHQIVHHQIDDPDCPDSYAHVIRIRHEREAELRRKHRGVIIG